MRRPAILGCSVRSTLTRCEREGKQRSCHLEGVSAKHSQWLTSLGYSGGFVPGVERLVLKFLQWNISRRSNHFGGCDKFCVLWVFRLTRSLVQTFVSPVWVCFTGICRQRVTQLDPTESNRNGERSGPYSSCQRQRCKFHSENSAETGENVKNKWVKTLYECRTL